MYQHQSLSEMTKQFYRQRSAICHKSSSPIHVQEKQRCHRYISVRVFSRAVINGEFPRSRESRVSPRYRNRTFLSSVVFFCFPPLADIMHVSDFDRDSARRPRHSSRTKGRTDNIACQGLRYCTSKHQNPLSLTRTYLPRRCRKGYEANVFSIP